MGEGAGDKDILNWNWYDIINLGHPVRGGHQPEREVFG